MATFGTLDKTRHGQIQTYFPYTPLDVLEMVYA